MIEDRTRQHQTIEKRDRHADRNARVKSAQHAAGGGSVDVQVIAAASEAGWNHERLSVSHEPDMADECFDEIGVDLLATVNGTLRFAHEFGAW